MIVHVHQQRLRKGLPALILKSAPNGKHLGYHEKVKLTGEVHVVQPGNQLSCGARAWIEAEHGECACSQPHTEN